MKNGDVDLNRVKQVRGPFLKLDPHPDSCSTVEQLVELASKVKHPLAADLFCGAGGLSLGLRDAGFDVVLAVDHDDEALETHRANHPGLSVNWDLGSEEVIEQIADLVIKTKISLVAGGPPCQPFSKAGRSMIRGLVNSGRRDHHDHRRDLWESFLGVVELSRPQAVLMENVPDMALDRGMVILRTMIERLENLGYSVEERVVETWRYGVPQFRQRLILVAMAKGIQFEWPQESEVKVTVENAIGDLPRVEGGWRPSNGDGIDPVASGWLRYAGPSSTFQKRARAKVGKEDLCRIYDQITRPVRPDDAIAFSKMTHETRYSDLDESLKRYRDDIFDDKYKRLNPNNVSRTITAHIAKDGYGFIHPTQDRTLTVREAARIQSFGDEIRFAGPPSSAFRQIGNAVPVLLGEHIGKAILKSLKAGRKSKISTQKIAGALATWFRETQPVAIPWLDAENRWQVIQSEFLWGRLGEERSQTAWDLVKPLTTPAKTLKAMDGVRRVAKMWGRGDRSGDFVEMVEWFDDHRQFLKEELTALDLTKAPHLGNTIASLACRIVPGETEDPVLASYGVLRVAARFQGDNVDRQNRMSDGRLAIARMISKDADCHEAHLALIEIANKLCTTSNPTCEICPLKKWCFEKRFNEL